MSILNNSRFVWSRVSQLDVRHHVGEETATLIYRAVLIVLIAMALAFATR